MSGYGPCEPLTLVDQTINTIHCDNGVCLGLVRIIPAQYKCMNQNEKVCEEYEDYASLITYDAMSEHHYVAELLVNAGLGVVCSACVITAVGASGVTGGASLVAIELACGAACAAAFSALDPCLFTDCLQDYDTRMEYPGGHFCQE